MSVFSQSIARVCFLAFANCLMFGVATSEANVDFEKEIKPIFASHCLSCHDEENEEGGFIIDRSTTLDYVISGDAEESDFFMHLVTDDEDMLMPPADAENPLSDGQITLVRNWINEGAEWPEGIEITPVVDVATVDNAAVAGDEDTTTNGEDSVDKTAVTPQQVKNAAGSLHPAATHLPMGLLLVAGLFSLLSLRGNFVMSDCAYYCLWIGALGAIAASVTGWFYSPMEHQGDVVELADLWDTSQKIFMHRTGALACSVGALLLALMATRTRAHDPDDGMLWKLGAIVLAAAIGWVGHEGGELTYGKAHYKDLHAVIGSVFPAWNELGAEKEADPAALMDQEKDEADAIDLENGSESSETESSDSESSETGVQLNESDEVSLDSVSATLLQRVGQSVS